MTPVHVVLHAHSDWSYDGHWSLARIARFYGRFGVRAVMMTEHDTGFDPEAFGAYRAACAEASTPRCRLVPGIEYSSPDNAVHILTWGLDRFLTEHRPVAETLDRVRAAGGVAVFAHPVRRDAWSLYDPDWTPLLAGIEIWNRKSDGITAGREALRLVRETGLPPTVGQDFHRPRHAWPLTMRAPVTDPGDPETDLVAALAAGAAAPHAFGRPLIDPDGTLRLGPHDRAEGLRRRLRDAVRRGRA